MACCSNDGFQRVGEVGQLNVRHCVWLCLEHRTVLVVAVAVVCGGFCCYFYTIQNAIIQIQILL